MIVGLPGRSSRFFAFGGSWRQRKFRVAMEEPVVRKMTSSNASSGDGRAEEGGWCDGPEHAALYADFRPEPPTNLVTFITQWMRTDKSSTNNSRRALDVGCGPGQSTRALAAHFQEVIGVDVSKSQIGEARKAANSSNIAYHVIEPECFPLDSGSCDLVIAVQACHWFDLPKFFKEADRVLAPGGTLALVGYNLPVVESPSRPESSEELKKLFLEFYEETRPFWREERRHIENEYAEFVVPYPDTLYVRTKDALEKSFHQLKEARLTHFRGYLNSWTGFRNYSKAKEAGAGERRLDELCQRMAEACKMPLKQLEDEEVLHLKFPFFFRLGRKPKDEAFVSSRPLCVEVTNVEQTYPFCRKYKDEPYYTY